MGIKDQLIFPEINYDKVESVKGMNVTIATSSVDDSNGLDLLTEFGFPFRNNNSSQ
jgi:large subunit ribosomal protein L5